MKRLLEGLCVVLAGYAGFASPVLGQAPGGAFPTRSMTIVVPFPPGGLTDPVARAVGHAMSESFKQPVVVENRPGASGIIAAELVKKAAADGHVILMAATGHIAANPLMFSKLPYEARDFAPVSLAVSTPHLLVIPGSSSATNVAELVAMAKANPKGLSYASQGTGGAGHLLGELLKMRTGVRLDHVPYKGSGPGLLDLAAGRVDFFFDAISSAGPLARDGRLRAIAVASRLRAPQMPNVPTMAEAGFAGIELDASFGFLVPAATPAPAVRRLNEEIVRALREPGLNKVLVDSGLRVIGSSSEEYVAFIQSQRELLGKVIKESGIRLD